MLRLPLKVMAEKISLIGYDEETKTAKMLLQGACSGCPSSTATLKGGIENLLKQFVPELVQNVNCKRIENISDG